MNLKDYVKVYDNVLDKKYCKQIVQLFNENEHPHERFENNHRPQFTQVRMTKHYCEHEAHQALMDASENVLQQYFQDTNMKRMMMPEEYRYEQFRIKKYFKGTGDQFADHVDVADHDSARRFLTFFFYLNGVNEGGETVFPTLNNFKVKPRRGRVLVFPPMWMFPHIGMPTISHDKYIVGSYLHYV